MHVKRTHCLPELYFRPKYLNGHICKKSEGYKNWTPMKAIPEVEIPNNITGWKGVLIIGIG